MRDMEVGRVRPVVSHQQPPGETRFYPMKAGTGGRLPELAHGYIEETFQLQLKRVALFKYTQEQGVLSCAEPGLLPEPRRGRVRD